MNFLLSLMEHGGARDHRVFYVQSSLAKGAPCSNKRCEKLRAAFSGWGKSLDGTENLRYIITRNKVHYALEFMKKGGDKMEALKFLNGQGDFLLTDAQRCPEAYFPLVNEGGMMSSITPLLAGDCKTDQNTFLLAPASAETLQESTATRNFWVCRKGEKPWSVTGKSAAQRADETETSTLTGGLLWQKLTRESADGLRAETLSFVPAGQDRVEILQVSLTNTGTSPFTFSPVAAIPLYGRSADNIRDHRHVTSLLHRITLTKFGVDLHPTLTFDERGHQKGEITYRVWGAEENGAAPAGFLPLVRDFVGCGSYDWPQALTELEGVSLLREGDTAQGGEAVASLFFRETTLAPGETRRYQVVLAVDDDPAPYLTAAGVEAQLEKTKDWWQKAASQHFHTGDTEFDAWMRWVGIQPLLRRICGCSFLPHHDYGRGGRGWRDLWQDSLALLLTDPAATRNDLLCYFAGVRTDGTNATIIGTKPGEFKADRNNIPRVWMDHGFWPLLTVNLYLDETGDDDFLLEEQPYFADTLAFRGEGGPRVDAGASHSGTVLEHLLIQAVTAFFDVGEHGHMRLRGADWNDGLDMARSRGESVAFTAAYAGNFATLSTLLKRLEQQGQKTVSLAKPLLSLLESGFGSPKQMQQALYEYCSAASTNTEKAEASLSHLTDRMLSMRDWLWKHIRETEWTGDGEGRHWFNSYYDDSGRAVEGVHNGKPRMMLTGQVFCLLSGTADGPKAQEIVEAADRYLYDENRGGYCLNTDFEEVKLDMGRMFGFAYGHKENGAVFCHMAVMYAYALYSRGFAKEGWKVLENLYRQSSRFEKSRILPGIPEYFDDRGRGMYPYLTGAGSWWLLTLQTQAFGVRGKAGDLVLAPKLTAGQFTADGKAEITCASAGHTLHVCYENPDRLDWGEYMIQSVICGGQTWAGQGTELVIPAKELPAGELTITVKLAAK